MYIFNYLYIYYIYIWAFLVRTFLDLPHNQVLCWDLPGMDSQPPVEPDANYGGVTLSQLEEFLAVRKGALATGAPPVGWSR